MLMEMAGSRSCRVSAFHEDGPDEQNARGSSIVPTVVTNVVEWSLRGRIAVAVVKICLKTLRQPQELPPCGKSGVGTSAPVPQSTPVVTNFHHCGAGGGGSCTNFANNSRSY